MSCSDVLRLTISVFLCVLRCPCAVSGFSVLYYSVLYWYPPDDGSCKPKHVVM
jgi:hypothetical protein